MRKGTLQVPPTALRFGRGDKGGERVVESRGIPPFAENAKDGAPDLWLPVTGSGHSSLNFASASRLLGMTKDRLVLAG